MDLEIEVIDIDYHRNGTHGTPFYAIIFKSSIDPNDTLIGTYFSGDEEGETKIGYLSVLSLEKCSEGKVSYGINSWRGDIYEQKVYEAIQKFNAGELKSKGIPQGHNFFDFSQKKQEA